MKTPIYSTMLLLVIIIITLITTPYDKSDLKVLLRYDDFENSSLFNAEQELFKIAHSKGGSVLVGVIPYRGIDHSTINNTTENVLLRDEKVNLLRKFHKNGSIEIAAHGFNHKNNNKLKHNSEFAGLSEESQLRLLGASKKGLEELLGFEVTTFIPPFNAFDKNTISALSKTGFTLLSSGSAPQPYDLSELNYIPGGPYPYKLRSVVNSAISINHYDATIISTAHPYDIKEFGKELPPFRKDKKQVSLTQITNDLKYINETSHVRFVSLQSLRNDKENFSANRLYANNKLKSSFITTHRLLPKEIKLYPLSGLYYSMEAANDMYIRQLFVAIPFYIILLLVAYSIARYLLSLSVNNTKIGTAISLTALLGVGGVIMKIYLGEFYFLSAFITSISMGLLIGSQSKQIKNDLLGEEEVYSESEK